MDKKLINIGLDIGIASVGWCITDQDLNILEHGVRLFETVDSAKDSKLLNETRREKRHARRLINRRKVLKRDFIKLLYEQKLINFNSKWSFEKDFFEIKQWFLNTYIIEKDNKYDRENYKDVLLTLRKKAYENKIALEELIRILYWYLSNRGFKYEIAGDKEYQKLVEKLNIEKNKLPFEIQLEEYQKDSDLNKFRGSKNRLLHNNDYWKEIEVILDNHSNLLDSKFKDNYQRLFKRQRNFENGPGPDYIDLKQKYSNLNLDLISKYSKYYIDEKTGEVKAYSSIWEKTVGKCTYFPEEYRAPKDSITAQIFNLLNDLNNLYAITTGEVINKELKIECLKKATTTRECFKSIEKILVNNWNLESIDEIKGFRIDENNKKLLSKLDIIHDINKEFKKHNLKLYQLEDCFDLENFKIIDNNELDVIVDILSKNKEIDIRIQEFKKIGFDEIKSKVLSELGAYSTNHSLSYKAMQLMIPILIIERKNQMQIAHENNWGSQVGLNNNNSKYINLSNKLDKLVGTPTVKRSIRQTINLINAIIKKYSKNFKVNNIVIEMAREHNNKDVKDNQRQLQKFIKNQKDLIENEFNIDLDKSGKNKNTNFLLKLWLWKQQEGRDAYDGEFIDKNDLLHNHWSKYEIDHIIPYSISFDDSRKNKVLTKSINNQNKGNRTPYSWNPNIIQKMESQWKKWYYPISTTTKKTSDSLKSIDKYYYLISKHNYSDPNNQKDFIARNLVDTRYTTKFVLFLFKDFIDNANNKHILFETKIKTINGKMTNFFRKMINRIKDQDKRLKRPLGYEQEQFNLEKQKNREWNGHHAEDAYIILNIALKNHNVNKYIEKYLSNIHISDDKKRIESVATAILEKNEIDINIEKISKELNEKLNDIKFSYMINKKRNVQLFNETLYRGKYIDNDLYKISKIKLVDLKKEDFEKIKNNPNDYLMYSKDKSNKPNSSWQGLLDFFENNKNKDYPFKNEEENDLDQSNGEYITIEIKNKNRKLIKRKIKHLYFKKEIKKIDEVIFDKNQINKTSFYDSMNWIEIHLFKDVNGKYRLIPITTLNAFFDSKTNTYRLRDRYFEQLKQLNIDNKEPIIQIYKGTIFQDEDNNLFRVCGHRAKIGTIEFKRLAGKNKNDQDRIFKAINTIKNWKIINLDYLGNKYLSYTI